MKMNAMLLLVSDPSSNFYYVHCNTSKDQPRFFHQVITRLFTFLRPTCFYILETNCIKRTFLCIFSLTLRKFPFVLSLVLLFIMLPFDINLM